MYEIYQKLLDQHGLKNSDIARATGISNMTLSDWKNGKSTPKHDKIKLIAEYFHVSAEYLMTGVIPAGFSEQDAILDAKISNDLELKKAIQIYYNLEDLEKKYIIDLIYLLGKNH